MCLIFTHVFTYVVCTLEINGRCLFRMHNDLCGIIIVNFGFTGE